MSVAARENTKNQVPNLQVNIREAIRLGKTQCTEISRFCTERLEIVFNELRRMVSEGTIQTRRDGALTFYELAPKSKSPAGNPDFIKLNILKAIKENYRTVPWIKKHAGIEGATDISGIIDALVEDGIIFRDSNPELTALFIAGERPKNFYQEQDGTVHVDFEEEKQQEEENIMAISSVKPAKEKNATRPTNRRGINWTPALLEDLAATYYSYSAAGKSLNIDLTAVRHQVLKNDENKSVWDRGQKTYLDTNEPPKYSKAAKSKTEIPTAPKTEETAAPAADVFVPKKCAECETEFVMETYLTKGENDFCNESCLKAFEKNSVAEEAAQPVEEIPASIPEAVEETESKVLCLFCDKPIENIPQGIAHNDFFCSPECSLAERNKNLSKPQEVHTDDRFAHTIDHLSENGHSKDSFELAKASVASKAVEVIPPPQNEPNDFGGSRLVQNVQREQVGYIPIESGGEITVGFTGNFFAMTREEREKLNQLANLVQN